MHGDFVYIWSHRFLTTYDYEIDNSDSTDFWIALTGIKL